MGKRKSKVKFKYRFVSQRMNGFRINLRIAKELVKQRRPKSTATYRYRLVKIKKTKKKWSFKYKRSGKKLFRTSFCINFGLHHCYYSLKLSAWNREKSILTNLSKKGIEEYLLERLEEFIGYDKEEFWFDYTLGVEEPKEVEYQKGLNNRLEIVWEFLRCGKRGIRTKMPPTETYTISDFMKRELA